MHRQLRPLELREPRQRRAKRLLVEKEQRCQRLVLRRGSHVPIAREVIEERRYLFGTELGRMALAGKVDKPLDPMNVGFFGALAVVQPSNRVAHALEYSRRLRRLRSYALLLHRHSPVVGTAFGRFTVVTY